MITSVKVFYVCDEYNLNEQACLIKWIMCTKNYKQEAVDMKMGHLRQETSSQYESKVLANVLLSMCAAF